MGLLCISPHGLLEIAAMPPKMTLPAFAGVLEMLLMTDNVQTLNYGSAAALEQRNRVLRNTY